MTDKILSELEEQWWRESPKCLCCVRTDPMYVTAAQHDAMLERMRLTTGKDIQPPITLKGRELRVKE